MINIPNFAQMVVLAALTLTACSNDDDDADGSGTQLNPDLQTPDNAGEPGGDTTAIAGLWDGSEGPEGATDVIYWNIADNGVLTRYDYQQDGAPDATGENCYLVGDPITLTPEGGNDYSIANVAVTAVRTGDTLNIDYVEADSADIDGDGDTTETPSFSWSILTTPTVEDLNSCS